MLVKGFHSFQVAEAAPFVRKQRGRLRESPEKIAGKQGAALRIISGKGARRMQIGRGIKLQQIILPKNEAVLLLADIIKLRTDAIALDNGNGAPVRYKLALKAILLPKRDAGAKIGILMLQHNIAQFLDGNELCYLIPDLRKVQGGARIDEYGFLLSNDQIRVAVQRHLVAGSTHPVNAVGKGDWLLTVHRHKQSPFLGAAVISLLYSGRWRLFLPVAGRKRKRKQNQSKVVRDD